MVPFNRANSATIRTFFVNFFNGPHISVKSSDDSDNLRIEIKGRDGHDETHHFNGSCEFGVSKYYENAWNIKLFRGDNVIEEHNYNPSCRRIVISLLSSSLGDTLAWIPYVEEYRSKHPETHVIALTYHNNILAEAYPDIEFMEQGSYLIDIYAVFKVGILSLSDGGLNPEHHPSGTTMDQPLQRFSSDILGLAFREIRGDISIKNHERPMRERYVCIGIHSTMQAKYWNNPKGWQDVVDELHSKGYKVVLSSSEGVEYMGNKAPNGVISQSDYHIDTTVNYLDNCEFFIGIGSGLSWLAWSLGKKVVLISGFSEANVEPTENVIRISAPESKCSGCYNRYPVERGDWNWCPDQPENNRFECSRSINSSDVIQAMHPLLQTVEPIVSVALNIIATGAYDQLAADIIPQIREHFLPNTDCRIFCYTDSTELMEAKEFSEVTFIRTPHTPVPLPSLLRYHYMLENAALKGFDYIYYMDVDMSINKEIDDNILAPLMAVKHWLTPNKITAHSAPGWEDNPNSSAYFNHDEAEGYYHGSFQGGEAKEYLNACRQIDQWIRSDLSSSKGSSGYIAKWFDESYWNRYVNQTTVELLALPPSYAQIDPDLRHQSYAPEELSLDPIIVQRAEADKPWGGDSPTFHLSQEVAPLWLDRNDISRICLERGYETFIEVGTLDAQWITAIANQAKSTDFMSVDRWLPYADVFTEETLALSKAAAYRASESTANHSILEMESTKAAQMFQDQSIDVVYLDGDHSDAGIRADLAAWAPKVKIGGILAGHDYVTGHEFISVIPAVDEFAKEHGLKLHLTNESFPSWAFELTH